MMPADASRIHPGGVSWQTRAISARWRPASPRLVDAHRGGEGAGPLGFARGGRNAGHVRLDQGAAGGVEQERSRHVVNQDLLGLLVVGQPLLGINRSVAKPGESVELLITVASRLRKGRVAGPKDAQPVLRVRVILEPGSIH